MNREEFLKQAKPVLFNTEMVKAILEGRKTVTRRVVKRDISNQFDCEADGTVIAYIDQATGDSYKPWEVCRFKKGDYLYVRETWCKGSIVCGEESDGRDVLYVSQCEGEDDYILKAHALHEKTGIEDVVWKPSIHMPKEAARIFLKVKDVRVERLQDITEEQAKAEGIGEEWAMSWWKPTYSDPDSGGYPRYRDTFVDFWNSTIKKADLDKYGWEANPWVWVIEFERVEV